MLIWQRPEDVPEDVRNRLRENLAKYEKHPVQGPDDAPDQETRDSLVASFRSWGEFVTGVLAQRAVASAKLGMPLQCRAGCSACCSDYAMVSPEDMFLLIDAYQKLSPEDQAYVREKNAIWMEAHAEMDGFPLVYDSPAQINEFVALLAEDGATTSTMTGMTTSLNWRKKTPCSFLKAGKCMVYDSRPLACRGHNVVDPRGPRVCEEVLHVTEQLGVQQFEMSDACAHVIQQYVGAGLPMFPNGELNALFARWLGQQPQNESTP